MHNPYLLPKERLTNSFKYTKEGIYSIVNETNKEIYINLSTKYITPHYTIIYNDISYNVKTQYLVIKLLKELLNIPEGWIDDQGCAL